VKKPCALPEHHLRISESKKSIFLFLCAHKKKARVNVNKKKNKKDKKDHED